MISVVRRGVIPTSVVTGIFLRTDSYFDELRMTEGRTAGRNTCPSPAAASNSDQGPPTKFEWLNRKPRSSRALGCQMDMPQQVKTLDLPVLKGQMQKAQDEKAKLLQVLAELIKQHR